MRRAFIVLVSLWAGAAHAQQAYSDAEISQALTSTSWCSFSYNQTSGYSRNQRATFQSSGILTVATRGEGGSSGPAGSVYSQSDGGDTYRWEVRGGRLILANEEGVQDFTLDESRTSSGAFVLLVDGQEWTPCN